MLIRPRRNRKTQVIREMTSETHVSVKDLIYPLFLIDGKNIKQEISSLPGVFRMSIDILIKEVEECVKLGLNSFVLFPIIPESKKDKYATYSFDEDNFYLKAIFKLKELFPHICLMSDVAMDPYSSDGHDGIVENGLIMNDSTLKILGKMALVQAQAGIDIIGPSDMMDGRVKYIREMLDTNSYTNTSIMSYTAKYASACYGPFRDALDSAPKFGDKKTYQMNYSNKKEALIEAELDTIEGADFLMVKPALMYLDIIHLLNENFNLPISAYNVSGEYAMIKASSERGWIDYDSAMLETLTAIKRAGAKIILTYFAKDFARLKLND